MKTIKLGSIALAIALVAACGGKKKDAGTGSADGSAMTGSAAGGSAMAGSAAGSGSDAGSAAGSAAGSGSSAAAGPVDVPTEEDFEDEAAKKITETNVDDSVKQLEQDLAITP